MRRVVVTGLGAISPLGHTVKENWDALMKGASGIARITQFDPAPFACQIAGEVKNFVPEKHIGTKDIKKMDRFIQLCMVAGEEAFKNSGLELAKEPPERLGANVGVGIGGLVEIQAQHKVLLEKGPRRVSPFFVPMIINNLAAGQLSLKYGLKGPNLCITTACSSSAHAIGEAFRAIQRGDADVMFAGGAEAAICELSLAGFGSARALSVRNDEPTKASRPFDKDRDGFVMGEGAAILILEEWEHAKKRGAQIHGELTGYALNADAFHITAPSPEGEGAARCMTLTLKDAKVNPTDVDYINAHGTSTPLGDAVETTAIKSVFGNHAKTLTVSSTKSMTGHLLGAAGAIEALYCIEAAKNQVIPPTINLDSPSPECDLNYAPKEPQQRKINVTLSNSFGFGGTNACLLFRRAP